MVTSMRKTTFEKKLNMYDDTDKASVQTDLRKIEILMKGNRNLTKQLAKEIYFRIKYEEIRFYSLAGMDFLDKLTDILTDAEIHEVCRQVDFERQKKKNKRKMRKLNKGMAVAMFAVIFLVCFAYLNWNLLLDYRTNYEAQSLHAMIDDDYEEDRSSISLLAQGSMALQHGVDRVIEDQEVALANMGKIDESRILGKFRSLYDKNEDFRGWLSIEGTKIDYPVMSREDDNDYYLDKNFEHETDKNGLLILDYRCHIDGSNQNMIIYGHNMRTGVMFGTLKKYKDKAFGESHPTITFDTIYENAEYEVVAAMLSEVAYADEDVFRYYDAIDMSTQADFDDFWNNVSKKALYVRGELSYGDACLILSTCDNYKEDGRFVVIAKKVQNQ